MRSREAVTPFLAIFTSWLYLDVCLQLDQGEFLFHITVVFECRRFICRIQDTEDIQTHAIRALCVYFSQGLCQWQICFASSFSKRSNSVVRRCCEFTRCHRPLSRLATLVHVESQENKKLCFCTANLAQTRIQCEARLNVAPRDKRLLSIVITACIKLQQTNVINLSMEEVLWITISF